MTVNKLAKITAALVAAGHGLRQVCIDKTKFNHPLEPDGCCIIVVVSAALETHEMMDDDGGRKELANGQTAYRTALVLRGCE